MAAATSFSAFTHSPWNKSFFNPRQNKKRLLEHTSFRSLPLPKLKLKLNCRRRRLPLQLHATPDPSPKPSPKSGFLSVVVLSLKSFWQWKLRYFQDNTEVVIDVVWKTSLSIIFAEWKLPYTLAYIAFKTLIYPGLKLRGDDGKPVLRLPWRKSADDSKKEEAGDAESALPITRTIDDKFSVLPGDIKKSFKVKVTVVIEGDDGNEEKEED